MGTALGAASSIEPQTPGLVASIGANDLPGGFFVCEAHDQQRIRYANDYVIRLYGCTTYEQFLSHVQGTLEGMIYFEDQLRIINAIWVQISHDGKGDPSMIGHVVYRMVDVGSAIHYADVRVRLVVDACGKELLYAFVSEVNSYGGMAQGAKAGTSLVIPANVDVLTGLPSMRYYHEHTGKVLAQAAIDGLAMADVYFDVDHFRSINSRLGYAGGDEVLQRIAHALCEVFPNELLSRFSDDHFVLVTQREGLEQRLDQVHDRVARIVPGMRVELKAGVYELERNETYIPFAHDRAKVACDSIKGRYDRTFCFYDEALSIGEDLHEYVVNNIGSAIEQGWIKNHYQPVVRIGTRLTCGIEALSRWVDPKRGSLAPAQFVSVLEEAHLVHLLDQAVISRVCEDVKKMQELGISVPVSINFAPIDMTLIDIPSMLESKVQQFGIDRNLLHVEITESSLAEDPEHLRSVIRRLHDLGYKVWMDDFGSGYSSLNLLKDYDFDVLKIDMEFLRGMEKNEKSRTIVGSITNLAHELGMSTLVEGVETEGQFEFLKLVGADMAQGYLFSRPLPFEQLVSEFFVRCPPEG
ncbi:MAG: bifunctional diguanylate cyclase/phosphodiesterase [Coriobacteriales bacterium]|nr:bifunctional diguanylate cyclase/phosphodiesterase [Coriobacteriales bacterium]